MLLSTKLDILLEGLPTTWESYLLALIESNKLAIVYLGFCSTILGTCWVIVLMSWECTEGVLTWFCKLVCSITGVFGWVGDKCWECTEGVALSDQAILLSILVTATCS